MYAASSRRSTVRIQRQTSSRESQRSNCDGIENIHNRPLSSSSNRPARPNTANYFDPDRRPSTSYNSNSHDRVKQSRRTFMLADEDLDNFHRAFCYMAKSGDFAASAPIPKRDRKKKKTKKAKAKAKPDKDTTTLADFLDVDPATTTSHPWEEKDASKIRLTISDFFATFQLSHISNGGFLDGIFELVGTNNLHAMTFGEFLNGICTFGMFKLDDMIRFIFFILDKNKNGRIPRFQVLRLVQSIHAKKILAFEKAILPNDDRKSSNTKEDTLKLPTAERQKATVDYQDLKNLSTIYPTMFEPMLVFQSTLRRRVLGEVWWRRKENEIDNHLRTMDQRREKNRKREEKRLLRERKEKIIADVGRIPYYLRMGKSRNEAEKEYPKPIVAAVEETGVFHIEWTRTDGKDILDEGSVQT